MCPSGEIQCIIGGVFVAVGVNKLHLNFKTILSEEL